MQTWSDWDLLTQNLDPDQPPWLLLNLYQNMPVCCSHLMQRSNEAKGASCKNMLPVKHASQDLSGHNHAGCIWSYRHISCHQSNVFIELITQFPKFLVAQCLQTANTALESTSKIKPCTDFAI